ncbi:hypothetical protein T484DRAFT_1809665 [Baffinella frigidus]|nr:hypothetical protein T484DRAFT_1809665 [Cryptophyta sp. CCMP2293]
MTDVSLREFFDQAMLAAGLAQGDGSCVSDVWISAEKQFAFVEVRSIAEANNAMQLDGITLYGTPLRINRPHDYVPPGALTDPAIAAAQGMGGVPPGGATNLPQLMQITKKSRRVHVGNLPISVPLTPQQLRTFVAGVMQQMFLTVKPGDPVIDSFVSTDGKFGFVEMRTIQEASNALSMTGVELMGRAIRVGRPADYVHPTP